MYPSVLVTPFVPNPITYTSSMPDSVNTFTYEAKYYISDNGLVFVFGGNLKRGADFVWGFQKVIIFKPAGIFVA